ncbi:glycoside hydrolase family 48 protein [Oerskovia sp. M15]
MWERFHPLRRCRRSAGRGRGPDATPPREVVRCHDHSGDRDGRRPRRPASRCCRSSPSPRSSLPVRCRSRRRPGAERRPAAPRIAVSSEYAERFLEMYDELHDPANGYFSPQGIPYHSVETLIVEAPDHGHETTSEAYSFWLWLEAAYGRATADWTSFNDAWATMETYMIPQHEDQPTNSFYNPQSPATYAAEYDHPSKYPPR